MNVQETNIADNKMSEAESNSGFVSRQYVEVPARSGKTPVDALTQLAANINTLEGLQSQLSFMMREIRTLNKK